MKFIVILFLLVSASSCYKKEEITQSVAKCGLIETDLQEEVHWNNFPIHYYIEEDVPEEFVASIREAAQTWNKDLGFTAILINPKRAIAKNVFIDYNIIYWVKNPDLLPPNHQAETHTFWNESNVITGASILLNSPRYKFSSQAPNETSVDMKSLMVHEFGHALGLDHSGDHQSVMQPELGYGEIRQDVSQLDKAAVFCGVARKGDKLQKIAKK